MGRPAQEGGPRRARAGRRERESRWAGSTLRGPGWDPLVSGSAYRAEGVRGAALGCGAGRGACAGSRGCGCSGPTRSLTARGGPRARAGRREAADRDQLDPVAAEVAPMWRLRGCHAGRWEVDDDVGRNGRRTAAASGGANHGDTGESEHTGRLHGTRGDEPMARIRRGLLDGGGLRRRQPAAREGGNGDGATRDRFGRARASTRLRESVASVGLGGATPSEAGDERRYGARAATAASTQRAAATVGVAPASYGEATPRTGSSGTRDGGGRRERQRDGNGAEGGREGDEEEPFLLSLEARAGRGGAESMTTAMTAGAVWNGAATRAAGAGSGVAGADSGGVWPVGHHGVRARKKQRAAWRFRGRGAHGDGGGERESEGEALGAAHGQSGERGRERERDEEKWAERNSAHRT
uniref:Epstein-Barr virus EBNA-1-like n=1 Tax=Oryza glaberrima TaxID=4538 RepID=A0A679BB16_ORYGL|nr:Epstein-Barr virus EBNA-1-like [Oryza glaberrima]